MPNYKHSKDINPVTHLFTEISGCRSAWCVSTWAMCSRGALCDKNLNLLPLGIFLMRQTEMNRNSCYSSLLSFHTIIPITFCFCRLLLMWPRHSCHRFTLFFAKYAYSAEIASVIKCISWVFGFLCATARNVKKRQFFRNYSFSSSKNYCETFLF